MTPHTPSLPVQALTTFFAVDAYLQFDTHTLCVLRRYRRGDTASCPYLSAVN
jgi:hypothetical protein